MSEIKLPGDSAESAYGAASVAPPAVTVPAETVGPIATPIARPTGSAMDAIVSTQAGMTKQTVDAAMSAADHAAETAAATWVSPVVPLMDIYRDAAKRSADQMKSIVGAWMTVGKGMHELQLKWLETMSQSMASTGGTPSEIWQAQQRLYVTALESALASTGQVLRTASKTAEAGTDSVEVRH